jgi:Zn-dependent protease
MGDFSGILIKTAVLTPPILLALTVHEAAHALTAFLRGDSTAKLAGRLSLNPLRHLDMAGTLVFFFTSWFGSSIGWGKPVPVDYRRLRSPRWDVMWVSVSGPAVNLLAGGAVALLLHLLMAAGVLGEYAVWKHYLAEVLVAGVQVNVVFAFFNLLPLLPLDGSGVVLGLLPPRAAAAYQAFGRYGFAILLALIFLPQVVRGFPSLLDLLVVRPASLVTAWLLIG